MAHPTRPPASTDWQFHYTNYSSTSIPVHAPPTGTPAVQGLNVHAQNDEPNSAALAGMPPQNTYSAFSEPQFAAPAESAGPRRKRKKTDNNQRNVKPRVEATGNPFAQISFGNRFVIAIESAVTLSGDAFIAAKSEFLALPASSKECVEQYMLGCKILAQYAKAQLSFTEEACCQIVWDGLEKLHQRSYAARKERGSPLPDVVRNAAKVCAFDQDTPRDIILRSSPIMKIDFKGKDTSPEKTAAHAIRTLGLINPLKNASKSTDLSARQDPAWTTLLEKLKASASVQGERARSAQVAPMQTPEISPPQAGIVYRVGQYEVKGDSPAGVVIGKLHAGTLSSDDASTYLNRRNTALEDFAIYTRLLVLLVLYFEATRKGGPEYERQVFWTAMHTLLNDISRGKSQNLEMPERLEAIESELAGEHVPIKLAIIVHACLHGHFKREINAYLKYGLKPIVEKASNMRISAARLSYQQMLDMCLPQAPQGAPTPVFTTTTTVTTLASTTATSGATPVATASLGNDEPWPEFPPGTPGTPATPHFGKINWEGEPFDMDNPESVPDEYR